MASASTMPQMMAHFNRCGRCGYELRTEKTPAYEVGVSLFHVKIMA